MSTFSSSRLLFNDLDLKQFSKRNDLFIQTVNLIDFPPSPAQVIKEK